MNLRMPHQWWPRPYQLPALAALDGGCRNVLLMHHRRAGKDASVLNWCATQMAREPTSVLYLLPEFKQAKRVLFRELNSAGKRHIDQAFPEEIVTGRNEQDGFIRIWNNSIFQIGGFDSIDSYVGVGPKIVVFSEYAVSKHGPRAYQLIQPILLANGGTTIFCYTPRGKNHGRDLYETAKADRFDPIGNPRGWHCTKLTVEDTGLTLPDGSTLLDAVRRDISMGTLDEEFARQEFWCSFEAPNSGSYYGRLLEMAEQQGRITSVPWDPSLPVFTWWDIGIDDANAIWFVQAHRGGELRFIDYIEDEGQPLSYYLDQLNERKKWGWSFEPNGQLVPHDFSSREYSTGESPEQAARKMGWRMTVVPATGVQEGIDAVRRILPRCWFDAARCKVGLDRLRNYTKRWSPELQRFTGPLHDESSHASDAVRTGTMGMRRAGMHIAKNPSQAVRDGQLALQHSMQPVVAVTDFSVWDR